MKKKKQKTLIQIINNHPSGAFQKDDYYILARNVIEDEKIPIHQLSIIAVDDEYLRKLHQQYLNNGSYTDVMTFKLSDFGKIEAEIYFSLDRAKFNATKYQVKVVEEYARLIIHGLLHLKGYDDSTEAKRNNMHQLENKYLRKYWESNVNHG